MKGLNGMKETLNIAGYGRISVDMEEDKDNTSIENQRDIITDYVTKKFPGCTLGFFADRDRSGYTFEQREDYQRLRPLLMNGTYDILVIKDFSRFSRRNSRGLVELEDLRDAGVRIISIGDAIDYPTYDDWTAIQFRFLINEMPVTDASKKVKYIIDSRQSQGKWVCAVPYGYIITNSKSMEFTVDEPAAEVIRLIFSMYNRGFGYKKIANYLTDKKIPTPRMSEKERREADGSKTKIKAGTIWSVVSVQGILVNDFYIGTLRQRKYTRKKINGVDLKLDDSDHIVFENHHEAIVDYRDFAMAQEQLKKRSTQNYRGIKKFANVYSGFLSCGDCGSPMFSMSREDLAPAYTCGTYHKRGTKGCSSHHTRVDVLDDLLKSYIARVKANSAGMIEQLELALKNESTEVKNNEETIGILEKSLAGAKDELKATMKQKVKELMRKPENEEVIEETFGEMIDELQNRIVGLENQIKMTADKRNTIIKVNRLSKTALQVFDDILNKDNLDKVDLELIIDKIVVYTDHIEVMLKHDIDTLLTLGTVEDIQDTVVQSSTHRPDKVLIVNVVSEGDPLEIYTEKDGEVIFKKYSPMGEWSESANQICETLFKTAGCCATVADRDSYISVCGVPKREMAEKHISADLEQLMEARKLYQRKPGEKGLPVIDGGDKYVIETAAPIISEGDVMGCVVFFSEGDKTLGEVEYKLAQTVAGFLGKQMES